MINKKIWNHQNFDNFKGRCNERENELHKKRRETLYGWYMLKNPTLSGFLIHEIRFSVRTDNIFTNFQRILY